eukprot:snap_masked-scaffold_19-processed-gene-4.21-mRNA-1 protein AED:1.00 eAED:1.00 QI:0/0/0/0/1/1/2/0/459
MGFKEYRLVRNLRLISKQITKKEIEETESNNDTSQKLFKITVGILAALIWQVQCLCILADLPLNYPKQWEDFMQGLSSIFLLQFEIEEDVGVFLTTSILILFNHLFFLVLVRKLSLAPKCISILLYPLFVLEIFIFLGAFLLVADIISNKNKIIIIVVLSLFELYAIIKQFRYWRFIISLPDRLNISREKLKDIMSYGNNLFFYVFPTLLIFTGTVLLTSTRYYIVDSGNSTDDSRDKVQFKFHREYLIGSKDHLIIPLITICSLMSLIILFEKCFLPLKQKICLESSLFFNRCLGNTAKDKENTTQENKVSERGSYFIFNSKFYFFITIVERFCLFVLYFNVEDITEHTLDSEENHDKAFKKYLEEEVYHKNDKTYGFIVLSVNIICILFLVYLLPFKVFYMNKIDFASRLFNLVIIATVARLTYENQLHKRFINKVSHTLFLKSKKDNNNQIKALEV